MDTTDQTAPSGFRGRYADKPGFVRRWILSPGCREVGTLYLIFAAAAGLLGMALSILLRIQPLSPAFHDGDRWSLVAAVHGLVMVFFTVIPALLGGFGNWFVPVMIGASDTAFPRLNSAGFWSTAAGFCLLALSLIAGSSPMAVGLAVAGLHVAGIGLLMGAINFIVTILTMRGPGVQLHRMPLFVWSVLVAASLILLSLPILAGSLTVLWLDRGFAAAPAAHVSLRQLFWSIGHPELYVMILPAFGIVSQVIPSFSRRPVYGQLALVYAMLAMGLGGFLVWGQHMFATGLSPDASRYYTLAAIVIAVPTGVKLFAWLATMVRGSVDFETPMLFATGLIALVTAGGLTGLLMGTGEARDALPASYYAVAHFHYVLSLGAVAGLFCGFYYWIGKMSGRRYPEWAGRVHFWLFFIGANLTFLPLHFLALDSLPNTDALYGATDYNNLASVGAGVGAIGYLWFVGLAVYTILRGRRVTEMNYWGEGANTLEWTVPTPMPSGWFQPQPRIK